jgi:RP/EB family microtubule-associated protein
MNDSVGLMHPAYFVGRTELLDWLNSTLQLKLSKIEETASGAVACQIFDLLFPNTVHMSKVNWGARSEWEFIGNYKVLQAACDKVGVDRKIEVDRLIKARQQDNLEFMQWLKKFFDDNASAATKEPYDPVARRNLGKGASGIKWCKAGANVSPVKPSQPKATVRTFTASTSPARAGANSHHKEVKATKPATVSAAMEKENSSQDQVSSLVSTLRMEIDSLRNALQMEKEENNERIARMELQLRASEEDCDVYLSKLKNVELALQALSDADVDGKLVIDTIKHVLNDEEREVELSASNE